MNRSILALGLFSVALLLLGSCSDSSDCLQCPPEELPRSVKILIAASEVTETRSDTMIAYSIEKQLFPEGTEFQTMSLVNSVPSLEELMQFDAVLIYTVAFTAHGDSIGDVMADYVDQGGAVVMCLYSMRGGQDNIGGRLVDAAGYAPLKPGGRSDDSRSDDRLIDLDSIEFPMHTIFHGIDLKSITYPGERYYATPRVDETAVLLAKDTAGANAVAINAAGNIIGLNIWPSYCFSSLDRHPMAAKLIASSLMVVMGQVSL